MNDESLFDAEPWRVEPAAEEAPGLSRDRKRTLRQAQAIRDGKHPLGLYVPGVRLHPEADRGRQAGRGPHPCRTEALQGSPCAPRRCPRSHR